MSIVNGKSPSYIYIIGTLAAWLNRSSPTCIYKPDYRALTNHYQGHSNSHNIFFLVPITLCKDNGLSSHLKDFRVCSLRLTQYTGSDRTPWNFQRRLLKEAGNSVTERFRIKANGHPKDLPNVDY